MPSNEHSKIVQVIVRNLDESDKLKNLLQIGLIMIRMRMTTNHLPLIILETLLQQMLLKDKAVVVIRYSTIRSG